MRIAMEYDWPKRYAGVKRESLRWAAVTLADSGADDGTGCRPGLRAAALRADLHIDTLRRAYAALCDMGLATKVLGTDRIHPDVYDLDVAALVAGKRRRVRGKPRTPVTENPRTGARNMIRAQCAEYESAQDVFTSLRPRVDDASTSCHYRDDWAADTAPSDAGRVAARAAVAAAARAAGHSPVEALGKSSDTLRARTRRSRQVSAARNLAATVPAHYPAVARPAAS